jgi:DivIVA domain-containing protein
MALAIEVLFAAAVLLAVGLAAAGRIDGMSRAVPDAPPGLPDGEVTPEGLRGATLPVVLRGYRMADVDEVLERAAAELEHVRAAAGITTSTPSPSDEPLPYEEPAGEILDDHDHDHEHEHEHDVVDG